MLSGDGNKNGKKVGLISKINLARAAHFFYIYLPLSLKM